MNIDGCDVKKVLVDPRSSANIMHKGVFNQMDSSYAVLPVTKALVKFNMASEVTRGR